VPPPPNLQFADVCWGAAPKFDQSAVTEFLGPCGPAWPRRARQMSDPRPPVQAGRRTVSGARMPSGVRQDDRRTSRSGLASGGGAVLPPRVFQATPMERIGWIRRGLKARSAQSVLTGWTTSATPRATALADLRAAVRRTAKRDGVLSGIETERVLGVAALIGQVQAMVEDSGAPQVFDAASWLLGWALPTIASAWGRIPWGSDRYVRRAAGRLQSARADSERRLCLIVSVAFHYHNPSIAEGDRAAPLCT